MYCYVFLSATAITTTSQVKAEQTLYFRQSDIEDTFLVNIYFVASLAHSPELVSSGEGLAVCIPVTTDIEKPPRHSNRKRQSLQLPIVVLRV